MDPVRHQGQGGDGFRAAIGVDHRTSRCGKQPATGFPFAFTRCVPHDPEGQGRKVAAARKSRLKSFVAKLFLPRRKQEIAR